MKQTVELFLGANKNFVRSSNNGVLHLIPAVGDNCKRLHHLTYEIVVEDDGVEYVGSKYVQPLDEFDVGGTCTDTCTTKPAGATAAWCCQQPDNLPMGCADCQCCRTPSSPTPAPGPAPVTPTPAPGPVTPTPVPVPGSPTPGPAGDTLSCLNGNPSAATVNVNSCWCDGCSSTGCSTMCKPNNHLGTCTSDKQTGKWSITYADDSSLIYIPGGKTTNFTLCPDYVSSMNAPVNSAVSFKPKSIVNKAWKKLSTDDHTTLTKSVVYVMLDDEKKYTDFKALLGPLISGKTKSPWDRFVIGFFRPDLDYTWDGKTTTSTIGSTTKPQFWPTTYKELEEMITQIKQISAPNGRKMEVYLSMGGWNYNCVPLFYTNSFNSLTPEPADWTSPEWGFKCEPRSTGQKNPMYTLNEDRGLLRADPTPSPQDTYTFFFDPAVDDADAYESSNTQNIFDQADPSKNDPNPPAPTPAGSIQPSNAADLKNDIYKGWSIKLKPTGANMTSQQWPKWKNTALLDDVTAAISDVPDGSVVGEAGGNLKADTVYRTFVEMAKKVGAVGVDLDYEEFWHADSFHVPDDTKIGYTNASTGSLSRTKAKLARIALLLKWYCLQNDLALSIPAPAVGVTPGGWYYGNLKGLFLTDSNFSWTDYITSVTGLPVKPLGHDDNWLNQLFDGGVCPMIYDLGGGGHDCGNAQNFPPANCAINYQVPYYLKQYTDWHIKVYIGFEIGRPAYPQTNDGINTDVPQNKTLPPLITDITSILNSKVYESKYTIGGFYWEIFKSVGNYTSTTGDQCCYEECPTTAAQASGDVTAKLICNKYYSEKCKDYSSIIEKNSQYGFIGCKLTNS